ncbi:MAG TPA: aspartate carbamoyltransferase catalytic subunit [Chloroflexota bacterium]|nr:aspartate carbamoyltransferase catalytic subunit [Chloroflexota bacterium]
MAAVELRPRESDVARATEAVVPAWPGRRHVLELDDFSPAEIVQVLDTAVAMKEVLSRPIKKVPALRGKTIVTMFYEPSTRTRVSVEVAAKVLGADAVNVTASGSSVTKGESLLDTLRTLQAIGADIVVMRHPQSGAPWVVASRLDSAVINGGDGWHAHPTQGLLDVFTIRERLGRVAGVRVTIVGDVLHSRVARSALWGLTKLGAQVTLCAPPTLMPRDWLLDPCGLPWPVRIAERIDDALGDADIVMALRLQHERQHGGLIPSIREYSRLYGLTSDRLKLARPGALVMHPGPMNEGVEIAPDVAHGIQSVIKEQVTNGVAVRMALLYLLSGGGAAPFEDED